MSKFSNIPIATIDVDKLKDSRFLLPDSRQLPYRDEAGLVNVDLCRRSMEALPGVQCSEQVTATLTKWAKHAEAWLAAGSDETRWSRGDEGKWRSATGEERLEVGKGGGGTPSSAPKKKPPAKQPREPEPATSNKRPAAASSCPP